jgi:alpha-mannosidase
MMVFGHGDGGGGPIPDHLESLMRLKDVDGLPRIQMRSSQEFFERCKNDAQDVAIWVGELVIFYVVKGNLRIVF